MTPGATNFSEFFRDLQQVVDDIQANRTPPSPGAPGDFWDGLAKVNTMWPQIEAEYAAHKGVVTAVADTLAALSAAGVDGANELREFVLELPGLLALAEKYVPVALEFRPMPQPLPGMGTRVGRG